MRKRLTKRDSDRARRKIAKKSGTEARKDMELFFDKKVFLELFVKVEKDWRNKDIKLKGFGYNLD